MISAATQIEIFKKFPKSIQNPDSSGNITAYVDWAERIDITEALDIYPIVVSFSFFGDTRDARASPINNLISTSVDGSGNSSLFIETIGERLKTTMSINVYSKSGYTDEYMHALMDAYFRDFPTIAGIVVKEHSNISDLSYMEEGITTRRHLDITLAYAHTVDSSSNTIETILYDASHNTSKAVEVLNA